MIFGGVTKLMKSGQSPESNDMFESSTLWHERLLCWVFAKKIQSRRSRKSIQNCSTTMLTVTFGARHALLIQIQAQFSWTKLLPRIIFYLNCTRNVDFPQLFGCSTFWTKIKNSPLCWSSAIFTFSMSVYLRFCPSKNNQIIIFSLFEAILTENKQNKSWTKRTLRNSEEV